MDNTQLVISTYNKIAHKYTNKYFTDKTDFPYIDKFVSFLPKNSRILDIGCGPGTFSKYLINKGFKVEGIDLSEEMLKIARLKVSEVKFNLMDMRNLEYPINSFDGLIVPYSLIHIATEEIPKTLDGFNRILKQNGLILIIAQAGEPDRIVDETLIKGRKMFINFFTRKKLKDYLTNTGFEVIFQKEKQINDIDSFSDRVIYTIARKI